MDTIIRTNTHVHSPYSFSSFENLEQMVKLASEQKVRILGINDFNTVEGFSPFKQACLSKKIYPLFNLEFLTRSEEDQLKGLRWNHESAPGLIYLCGKALNTPVNFCANSKNLLASLWKGSQDHVWKLIHKLNDHLKSCGVEIELEYSQIRLRFAMNTVRERHIAKALYLALVHKFPEHASLCESFRKIFNDPDFNADLYDSTSMQLTILDRLLIKNKPAFVEKSSWELSFEQAKQIILEAGGIPCYPVLANDKIGFTEIENDLPKLIRLLQEKGIHAVEFIPQRNSMDVLRKYVKAFREHDFITTFGTEHNTPEILPLIPAARGGLSFDEELSRIALEGALIFAAHQELHRQNQTGFIDEHGNRLVDQSQIKNFLHIGEEAVKRVNN